MKRIGMGALLLAAAATASAQFEGVADFRVTMTGEQGKPVQSTGKIFVTRKAYRTEFETDLSARTQSRKDGAETAAPKRYKMTMLGKLAEPDRITMINDERKTYSVMDLKKMREDSRVPKETYTVQKQGTDTVAGISCRKALVTSSGGSEFEVCVNKEWMISGDWLAGMQRNRNAGSWLAALRENGLEGFPIRWEMRRKGSPEATVVMELTHAEKKLLPASVFEVPAGYKESSSGIAGLTPEQEKAMRDARSQMDEALKDMTPEQRKAYEDAMKALGQPTPKP